MVGLEDVVPKAGGKERQLLVGVRIDHGSFTERPLQPRTDGPIHVLGIGVPGRVVVPPTDDDPHVHLVLPLVEDDLADVSVASAQCHSELELLRIALTEAERVPNLAVAPVTSCTFGAVGRVWLFGCVDPVHGCHCGPHRRPLAEIVGSFSKVGADLSQPFDVRRSRVTGVA